MKSDDELLDKITAHLRSQAVPQMPRVITPYRAARPRGRAWLAVAAGVLAASVSVLLWWQADRPGARPPPPPPDSRSADPAWAELRAPKVRPAAEAPVALVDRNASDVEVRDVDLSAPVSQLIADLDAIDREIAQLRGQAALLDARRKADELLAEHQVELHDSER